MNAKCAGKFVFQLEYADVQLIMVLLVFGSAVQSDSAEHATLQQHCSTAQQRSNAALLSAEDCVLYGTYEPLCYHNCHTTVKHASQHSSAESF